MASKAELFEKQRYWPLTHELAREYLDAAIENRIPTNQLNAEHYCMRIVQRARVDGMFFCQVFLAESFHSSMTWQHYGYWDVLDNETIPRAALCCARSFGKTTGVLGKIVQGICYRRYAYPVVVGRTYRFAQELTGNIKMMLLLSPRIVKVFGKMRARKMEGQDQEVELSNSSEGYYLIDPITGIDFAYVRPLSAGGQVRGLNKMIAGATRRPDLVAIDDLEDSKAVQTQTQREEIWNWLFADLLPIVDSVMPVAKGKNRGRWAAKYRKDGTRDPAWKAPWRVLYIDTPRHRQSAMVRLLQKPSYEWVTRRYPLCEYRKTKSGQKLLFSCVPERVSHEQVREKARDFISNPGGFAREYMCRPDDPSTNEFAAEKFYKYSNRGASCNGPEYVRFMIVDPARTTHVHSCYSAALVYAVNPAKHEVVIRKEYREKVEPDVLIDDLVEMAIEYQTNNIAVEVDGGDLWIQNLCQSRTIQTGLPIHWLFINAAGPADVGYGVGAEGRKKRDVRGVLPLYRKGLVYHEETIRHGHLEQAQQMWPEPDEFDVLDCLGHFNRVMKELGVFFLPQFVSNPTESFGSDEDASDRMERLKRAAASARMRMSNTEQWMQQMTGVGYGKH